MIDLLLSLSVLLAGSVVTGERRFLTTDQAAEYVGLSPRTLEAYRVRGGGPIYIKHGGARSGLILYRPSDLNLWIETRVRRSTSDSGEDAR